MQPYAAVRAHFGRFGAVADVYFPKDRTTVGGAAQFQSISLKAPGFNPWNLKCDILAAWFQAFAFNINLYRSTRRGGTRRSAS